MSAVPMHARRKLGSSLKQLRTDAALTVDNAVDTLGWSRTKLIRIEAAKVPLTLRDLQLLSNLYDAANEERRRLETLLEETRAYRWWSEYAHVLTAQLEEYIAVEDQAAHIRMANMGVLPGLLQTRDYAAAVYASGPHYPDPDQADAMIEVRLRRQRVLNENQVTLDAVIGEALLHIQLGGPEVLRGQLAHLTEVCDMPGVELRIVPFTAARVTLLGGITLFGFADERDPPVGYAEYEASMTAYDKPIDIRRLGRLLDHMTAQALSPEESRKLITTRMEQL